MAMDRAMVRDGIDILDLASLQRLSYQRYDRSQYYFSNLDPSLNSLMPFHYYLLLVYSIEE
jgi:hypothetical protein